MIQPQNSCNAAQRKQLVNNFRLTHVKIQAELYKFLDHFELIQPKIHYNMIQPKNCMLQPQIYVIQPKKPNVNIEFQAESCKVQAELLYKFLDNFEPIQPKILLSA